jgi:hypothetical protein
MDSYFGQLLIKVVIDNINNRFNNDLKKWNYLKTNINFIIDTNEKFFQFLNSNIDDESKDVVITVTSNERLYNYYNNEFFQNTPEHIRNLISSRLSSEFVDNELLSSDVNLIALIVRYLNNNFTCDRERWIYLKSKRDFIIETNEKFCKFLNSNINNELKEVCITLTSNERLNDYFNYDNYSANTPDYIQDLIRLRLSGEIIDDSSSYWV